ncbi:MAG: TIGR04283 family arsenosugar biosynthesis glycosyltransferase [Mariprofundus sp.]|nr:TIGR04283 family arsenosugar biosynthesis glycosyltransferase [Mariprofundus sp.]
MEAPHYSLAIVVPVFNERPTLRDRLQDFIALGADELVIVDGGSSDGTAALLSESGVQWLTSDLGRAAQMNAGSKAVSSDILVFIHIDTIISEGDLLLIKSSLVDSSLVGGRFDVQLSGGHWAFRVIEWMINVRSRLTKINTGDQVQFVRRHVFESMGGFAAMPLLEDVEFSKRLKREGRVACLPQQVMTSSRRWEKHGIASTVWLMWKIRWLYWLGVAPEKLATLYRDAR